MASISQDIVNLQNHTAQMRAEQNAANAAKSNSSVDSQAFLRLLTEQLQYQDPMNPMDNSEMLAQEAQFATLEQMESLTSSFTQFSNMFQANSLLGQTVQVSTNSGDVSGVVDYIDYTDKNGASLSINGTLYPISSVSKVYPQTNTTQDPTSSDSNTGIIKDAVEKIGENIGDIAKKLSTYLSNNSNTQESVTN